jgi:hypothetical protein
VREIIIATHLEQSIYLANQSTEGVKIKIEIAMGGRDYNSNPPGTINISSQSTKGGVRLLLSAFH